MVLAFELGEVSAAFGQPGDVAGDVGGELPDLTGERWDDQRAEQHEEADRGQEDDQDRPPAGDLPPLESPDRRVEPDGEDRRDHYQQEDVANRPRSSDHAQNDHDGERGPGVVAHGWQPDVCHVGQSRA